MWLFPLAAVGDFLFIVIVFSSLNIFFGCRNFLNLVIWILSSSLLDHLTLFSISSMLFIFPLFFLWASELFLLIYLQGHSFFSTMWHLLIGMWKAFLISVILFLLFHLIIFYTFLNFPLILPIWLAAFTSSITVFDILTSVLYFHTNFCLSHLSFFLSPLSSLLSFKV